jgi:hypothetical protein
MSGFLGMIIAGGASGGTPPVTPSAFIAYGGQTTSKRITVYGWDSSAGFGSAFTTPTIPAEIHQVSFVPDNSTFSASFWVAPYFYVWQWSSLGFGTRYADPGSVLNPASSGPAGFSWTTNLDALLTLNNSAPSNPQAWAWSAASGFGSKYSNGSVLASGRGVTLNADSTLVAFQQFATPWIALYPWSSSSGFGTKYANPSTLPNGLPPPEAGISFNKVTNDFICGSNASPFVFAYPVTSAGFGTKYANPASALNSPVYSTKFSADGASVATVNNGTPAVNAYQWGAGFGTKYANPAVLPPYGYSMDFSSTSNAIATGQKTASPYTSVYQWSTSGFGAKYSDPGTAPGVAATVSFGNQSR